MNDFIAASAGAQQPGRESWNGLRECCRPLGLIRAITQTRPASSLSSGSHHFYQTFCLTWAYPQKCFFVAKNTHLDDFVTGCKALDGGGAAGLNRGHKNADIVTSRQSDAHTSLLLEADKSWIRPAIPR